MIARRVAILSGEKVVPDDTVMWNVVNRYSRAEPSKVPGTAVTLVAAHATGFHKEASRVDLVLWPYTDFWGKIWETTFRYIISAMEDSPHSSNITEIWAIDAVNHGDSATLNTGKIGDVCESGASFKFISSSNFEHS
jgi:hypothetical protein